MITSNNTQAWNGDFSFGNTQSGKQNLNLGTGNVTLGASRNVTVYATALTIGGPISDGGNNFGLTMAAGSTGSLILTATSTYTGPTTVSAGTLKLGSSGTNVGTLGATAVSVASGATLSAVSGAGIGTATSTGGLTVLGGGTLTVSDTAAGTFTINGSSTGPLLTLASASTPATINLGTTANGVNNIVDNGQFLLNAGGATINLSGTPLAAPATYPLLSYGASTAPTGFRLGTLNAAYGYAEVLLPATSTGVSMQLVGASSAAYWTGATDGNWDTQNMGQQREFRHRPHRDHPGGRDRRLDDRLFHRGQRHHHDIEP